MGENSQSGDRKKQLDVFWYSIENMGTSMKKFSGGWRCRLVLMN